MSSADTAWDLALHARRHGLAAPMATPEGSALTHVHVIIYGNHMSEKQKTTVYLDAQAYRELKRLARLRGAGVSPAFLVREAVADYVARHTTRRRPRTVGAFASGKKDLSERAEELLSGMGRAR
jgi:hypothetical protein